MGALVPLAAAHAQTANTSPANVNLLNLLSPFLGLNATPVGQATLQGNLDQSVSINNLSSMQRRQLAISDKNLLGSASNNLSSVGLGTYGVAANLAGGLPAQTPINGYTPQQPVGGYGSVLGPIYQTGVRNGLSGPLANTVNLLTRAYNYTSSDLGVAKNYFANGTINGTTTAVAPTGYTLPTFNGLPNRTDSVLDLAYGVKNTQSGQDIYGSSRPVQVAPNRISAFDPTAITGLETNPSFPSGHTTYAYTDSLLLAMLVPQTYQSMLLRGSEYGDSRIVLGVHYPLDIIASRALASYDLAQAFTNANYINNAATTGTALSLPTLFSAASPELNAYLSAQCGASVGTCVSSAANTANNPYVPSAANQALYQQRLTYGLPTLTYAQAPREDAPAGGPDASILLAPLYGGSTTAAATIAPNGGLYGNLQTNTINQIIMNTEGTALAAFYGTPLSYWSRLDLYTAGGYFQNVIGTLSMAASDRLTTNVTVADTGVLLANGTIVGQTTVASGGTLGGTGTVGATIVNSGGTLAPGVSAAASATPALGTLTTNGNLTLNGGSTYLVQVTPTAASRTAVNGTTTINGATVAANFIGTSAYSLIGQTQAILTSSGTVTGSFSGATLTGALANSVIPTLVTRGGEIDLTYRPNTISSQIQGGATLNQRAVASGVDGILGTGRAPAAFVNLFGLAGNGLPYAFDQLSGVIHADAQTGMIQDAQAVRTTLLGRMRQVPYADGGANAALASGGPALMYAQEPAYRRTPAAQALAAKAPMSVEPVAPRRSDVAVWAQGFGSWGRFSGDANAPRANREIGGFLSGFDFMAGDVLRLGLAGGYSHTTLRSPTVGSSADVDSGHMAAYATASYGGFNLRAGGSYTFSDVEATRAIAVPFADTLHADYSARTGQIFGEIGYGMSFGQIAAEPFAGLAWVNLHTDGFSETGGLAALRSGSTSQDLGYSTLGFRLASNWAMGGLALTPRASFAWLHAFSGVTPTQSLAFTAGGPGFLVAGVPLARDAALIEAGLDLKLSAQASVGVAYVGQVGGKVADHGVRGNLTWRW